MNIFGGYNMKKIKKNIISIGAVFIALLLVSSVCAVPNTQSEPLNNYLELQEENLNFYPLMNVDSEEFAELFSDYYSSMDFISFITDSQTENMVSQLMDMAPTFLEYLRNEIDKKSNEMNMESVDLKVNEEMSNLFKSSIPEENTLISLNSQNLNMQVSEPLKAIDLEYYVMANELKSIYESEPFESIKNTVYEHLLNAGYDLGDDRERVLTVCADLITIGCFLQFLPVELFNIDYKLTESSAISKSALIALVPSVVIGFSLSPFTTLEGLSDLIDSMIEKYYNDDFLLYESTEISSENNDCGCGVQSEDNNWFPGKVVICAILFVICAVTFPIDVILVIWLVFRYHYTLQIIPPIFAMILSFIFIIPIFFAVTIECGWTWA
jgi:hypothetical protein